MFSIRWFISSFIAVVIIVRLLPVCRQGNVVDCNTNVNSSIRTNNTDVGSAFPNVIFFNSLAKYYRLMENLQINLDTAARTRQGVIGNIAWHPSQLYYYAHAVSYDWIANICEIGYGAGHSTLLYLVMNPNANVYSFDLFPDNLDSKVHTPGETMAFQQAFQSVTLKYIENDIHLASRFKKIIGNSNSTVPKFATENSQFRCDFLSIDGSHNPPQPFFDIMHSKSIAHKETIVVLDDMEANHMKAEMNKAIKLGLVREHECLRPEVRVDQRFSSIQASSKEFCAIRYENVDERKPSIKQ
jgi:hypothetical protein